jgi:ParB family chromosome partitioning protein
MSLKKEDPMALLSPQRANKGDDGLAYKVAGLPARGNTTPAPLAVARRHLARLKKERRLTRTAIAREEGKSCSALSHELRLMALPEEVQDLIDKGKLGKGHARALVTLPASDAVRIAKHVVAKRLTRQQTEMLTRQLKKGGKDAVIIAPSPDLRANDPDIRRLEDEISAQLQCRARLHDGWLSLNYGENMDVLDGLLERLQIAPQQ